MRLGASCCALGFGCPSCSPHTGSAGGNSLSGHSCLPRPLRRLRLACSPATYSFTPCGARESHPMTAPRRRWAFSRRTKFVLLVLYFAIGTLGPVYWTTYRRWASDRDLRKLQRQATGAPWGNPNPENPESDSPCY